MSEVAAGAEAAQGNNDAKSANPVRRLFGARVLMAQPPCRHQHRHGDNEQVDGDKKESGRHTNQWPERNGADGATSASIKHSGDVHYLVLSDYFLSLGKVEVERGHKDAVFREAAATVRGSFSETVCRMKKERPALSPVATDMLAIVLSYVPIADIVFMQYGTICAAWHEATKRVVKEALLIHKIGDDIPKQQSYRYVLLHGENIQIFGKSVWLRRFKKRARGIDCLHINTSGGLQQYSTATPGNTIFEHLDFSASLTTLVVFHSERSGYENWHRGLMKKIAQFLARHPKVEELVLSSGMPPDDFKFQETPTRDNHDWLDAVKQTNPGLKRIIWHSNTSGVTERHLLSIMTGFSCVSQVPWHQADIALYNVKSLLHDREKIDPGVLHGAWQKEQERKKAQHARYARHLAALVAD